MRQVQRPTVRSMKDWSAAIRKNTDGKSSGSCSESCLEAISHRISTRVPKTGGDAEQEGAGWVKQRYMSYHNLNDLVPQAKHPRYQQVLTTRLRRREVETIDLPPFP